MAYKYITENNLYEKQTYMYSEYGGTAFLKEYSESRKNALDDKGTGKAEASGQKYTGANPTKVNLGQLYGKLKDGEYSEETKAEINGYVKSFEVRKRIYTEYDDNWKPVADAGFEDYDTYLLFAECLIRVYEQEEGLKYFSCLLKVDDTLLSVRDRMGASQRKRLEGIIRRELYHFDRLADKAGLGLEEIK